MISSKKYYWTEASVKALVARLVSIAKDSVSKDKIDSIIATWMESNGSTSLAQLAISEGIAMSDELIVIVNDEAKKVSLERCKQMICPSMDKLDIQAILNKEGD
jgi:hypothetical protein